MRRSSVKLAARADLWNFFGAGMLFPPHAQMIDVSKVLQLQETVAQYYVVHSKSDGPLCWDVIAEW